MRKLFIGLFLVFIIFDISFAHTEIENCLRFTEDGKYRRAIHLGKKAVELYPQDINSFLCLADAYIMSGDFNSGIDILNNAQKTFTESSDLLFIYNRLALAYHTIHEYDNAVKYSNKYLAIARELKSKEDEIIALNILIELAEEKLDFDKAIVYYEEALKIADEKNAAVLYSNLGGIYREKGDYVNAINNIKKAIEINRKNLDNHGVAIATLNLGNTYRTAKDFVKAEKYINEGLKQILEFKDIYWEGNAYKYFGWLYRDKKDFKKAKEYLLKAYNIYVLIDREPDKGIVFNDIKMIDLLESSQDIEQKSEIIKKEDHNEVK